MAQRRRAAAVIVRNNKLLMVRERGRGPSGRHDGQEHWTLPGGGITPAETPEDALRREVREEVGLQAVAVRYLLDVPYPSGLTACFAVQVADAEPTLGQDEMPCDCPLMVGLDWVPLPRVTPHAPGLPVPTMLLTLPILIGVAVIMYAPALPINQAERLSAPGADKSAGESRPAR